ncbi:unnamed protein product [Arctia plantaginis]|uniref:FLYWCH-type domain-containing protein n=1 Tax=Arctia plantaginis TaxID=874455 RepID=A0A8S0ZPQ0_ARCPL|nr:unnamed protein product [Arctia plantaginis]CAB3250363.1 unnamed protein product [Arctia plantaginis]
MGRKSTCLLVVNGYRYGFKYCFANSTKKHWKCTNHKKSCKATVFTDGDEVVFSKGEHNHEPPGSMYSYGEAEYTYFTSVRGNRMLMYDGYKYTMTRDKRHKPQTGKMRWRCSTHHNFGCKAVLFTIEEHVVSSANRQELTYLTARGGCKLLSFGGNTYSLKQRSGEKNIWRCSKYNSRGCKVTVVMVGNEIMYVKNSHSHEAPISCDMLEGANTQGLTFVTARRGCKLLSYEGYTYSFKHRNGLRIQWRCSKYFSRGCRVTVVTLGDSIVSINNTHSHEAPLYLPYYM